MRHKNVRVRETEHTLVLQLFGGGDWDFPVAPRDILARHTYFSSNFFEIFRDYFFGAFLRCLEAFTDRPSSNAGTSPYSQLPKNCRFLIFSTRPYAQKNLSLCHDLWCVESRMAGMKGNSAKFALVIASGFSWKFRKFIFRDLLEVSIFSSVSKQDSITKFAFLLNRTSFFQSFLVSNTFTYFAFVWGYWEF